MTEKDLGGDPIVHGYRQPEWREAARATNIGVGAGIKQHLELSMIAEGREDRCRRGSEGADNVACR